MSPEELLRTALRTAIAAHAPFADAVSGVFDAPPARSALPHAQIDEPVMLDWSTKDLRGREARIALLIRDRGERPERLRTLAGEAQTAIEGMDRALGDGWRVASMAFLRSRVVRDGEARWLASVEYRLRMLRSEH